VILSDNEIHARCTYPTHYSEDDTPPFGFHQFRKALDPNLGYLVNNDYKIFTDETNAKIIPYSSTRGISADFEPMITPFFDHLVSEEKEIVLLSSEKTALEETIPRGGFRSRKVISYGLSSSGYDVRLGMEFKIFSNINSKVIDPKNFDQKCLVNAELLTDDGGKYVILPPNSYLLGKTIEYFNIPRDILVLAIGKSTYARSGAIVNVTPIENGFRGNIVIEVSNSTPSPLRIYANEGIAQFLFLRNSVHCHVSYADRKGKYQGQTSIQTSIV